MAYEMSPQDKARIEEELRQTWGRVRGVINQNPNAFVDGNFPTQPQPPGMVTGTQSPTSPPGFVRPPTTDFSFLNVGGYGGANPTYDPYGTLANTEKESAYQIIADVLRNYGLENLAGFVKSLVFDEDIINEDVIMGRIRQTNEYKKRFQANEIRRSKGLNVLSEAEYIAMERVYQQYFRQAGLPKDMWDENKDMQTLLANDVSVAELAQRINQGYEAVRNSDPQVVAEMKRLYGVNDSQLAAYFLDPERATPILIRQAQSAQIAGQARLQAGFELGMSQAEQLATAGITQEQAREGFQTIQQAQELFQALPFEDQITQQEQIAGVFGTNAAAQQRVRQRQRSRQAQFEQGGRFAGQGTTFTGLQ